MDGLLGNIPLYFTVALILFGVLFVGVLAFIATSAIRSRRVLREGGLAPMAPHADLASRMARSKMLDRPKPSEQRTLKQRLAELDELHRQGVISDEEHVAARQSALRGE